MADLIYRSDVLDIVHNAYDGWFSEEPPAYIRGAHAAIDDIYRKVDALPTLPDLRPTAQERPVGHWRNERDCNGNDYRICPFCGKRAGGYLNFCSYCGARMDGESDA